LSKFEFEIIKEVPLQAIFAAIFVIAPSIPASSTVQENHLRQPTPSYRRRDGSDDCDETRLNSTSAPSPFVPGKRNGQGEGARERPSHDVGSANRCDIPITRRKHSIRLFQELITGRVLARQKWAWAQH